MCCRRKNISGVYLYKGNRKMYILDFVSAIKLNNNPSFAKQKSDFFLLTKKRE